jgi:hypothetical protein
MELKLIAALLWAGNTLAHTNKDQSPVPPKINPNFVVNTVEVDDTNSTILEQRLVFDIDLRRSMMYGVGDLVKGAIQQIRRCDIHPEGWMTSAGGSKVDDPSTWSCTNTTISFAGEIPWNCQYSSFWSFPDDMKWAGEDNVNGVSCDKWVYFSGADEYALWASTTIDSTGAQVDVPIANGKIASATGGSLWKIYYSASTPQWREIVALLPAPLKLWLFGCAMLCHDCVPLWCICVGAVISLGTHAFSSILGRMSGDGI